ncbi:MAG: alpha-glucosidase C-terminal domain-containing protein, partial [Paracoccus sp. (in: a-proteobacteria)]|nr:alpha-glucosidase C-terminal domain-containing protein [Paracoccus sp. (in: a-proteobacteria)]
GFSDAKPWLPVKDAQAGHAVAGQQGDDSVLAAYRDTIAFRKSQPAMRWGVTQFLDLPEPVLAFSRTHDGQSVTCVFNLSASPVTLNVAGDTALTGPVRADLDGQQLHLPANGFAWLTGAVDLGA